MIIDCISDLHGYYPKLDGGDLLIVAGDLTASDQRNQYLQFFSWLYNQKYTKKILVAGNHDNQLENLYKIPAEDTDLDYLCDSGTEFEGLKIWGSPWTAAFPGMNPHCMAFTMPYDCDTDDRLAEKWVLIPEDIDILITHSPPYGIMDKTCRGKNVGSKTLASKVGEIKKPALWVWGHIHEAHGHCEIRKGYHIVNACHVNEHYEPVNKPVRIIL